MQMFKSLELRGEKVRLARMPRTLAGTQREGFDGALGLYIRTGNPRELQSYSSLYNPTTHVTVQSSYGRYR